VSHLSWQGGKQQAGVRWAIVPAGSTDSIGTVGFVITSKEERIAEIGFVVGRAHWGKGFCTAAVKLAISYGFKELGLAEVCAEVLKRNVASRRILDKLGFRIERSIANNPQPGSASEDCCTYALRIHEK
jgi:[ribosomal protein S5]-alanine N-acetyltransferase